MFPILLMELYWFDVIRLFSSKKEIVSKLYTGRFLSIILKDTIKEFRQYDPF